MSDDDALTVAGLVEALGLNVAAGADNLAVPITGAQVCDLLSFVISHGRQGHIWITIQTHPNIVAAAALVGLSAILLAAGAEPEEETLDRAEEQGIALLTSNSSAFALAGRVYELGVR
jgi:serine kinase of HPr protein (carbohydrate metabolism regulator)